jgi:ribosome modulation factor
MMMARKLGKDGAAKADKKKTTKERVRETVAEVTASNVTGDTKKEFFVEARDAKKELDEEQAAVRAATTKRNKANGAYRNVLKRASQAGISAEALADALSIVDRDPIEVARHNRQVNEFLLIAEFPLEPGGQYGLFADGESVAAKVDKAKMADSDDIEHAKEAGYVAGKAGKPETDCPFEDDGSPEALAWIGRHRDAQKENLAGLGRGTGAESQAAAH